ncbi:MAG: hypothetical protein RI925_1372, partial [Pseudomonadota bacterium]
MPSGWTFIQVVDYYLFFIFYAVCLHNDDSVMTWLNASELCLEAIVFSVMDSMAGMHTSLTGRLCEMPGLTAACCEHDPVRDGDKAGRFCGNV